MSEEKTVAIELGKDERGALERYVRRRTSALAQRSRVVLLAAEDLKSSTAERSPCAMPTATGSTPTWDRSTP
jgi:hypothetical protein